MSIIIDLVKSGKLKELKAQIFGQKLDENSKGTFTASLSESEENALAEAAISSEQDGWKYMMCQYMGHYPPFNSSLGLMIEHLELKHSQEMLIAEAKRWGFTPNILVQLCKKAIANDCKEIAPALEAYIKEPHHAVFNPEICSALAGFDQMAGSTFAKQYENKVKKPEEKVKK
jgi:hypothetical protein